MGEETVSTIFAGEMGINNDRGEPVETYGQYASVPTPKLNPFNIASAGSPNIDVEIVMFTSSFMSSR